jgi:hypothetical protein
MRVKRLVVCLSVIVLIVASGFFAFWVMGTSWFWGFQIAAYEKQDRINPPKPGVIVFTGSSSIRFWHSLSEDMKPLDAINRVGRILASQTTVAPRWGTLSKHCFASPTS